MSSIKIIQPDKFIHILRILNTNVNGKQKVMFALKNIKGIGRRFANIVLKRAGVDLNQRAGELTEEQVNKVSDVIAKPLEHNIPQWFLNRQKDPRDGVNFQMTSNQVDTKLREDLERMRKMRLHRGLRHLLGLKVRGQKTNKTGRRGKTVGVSRKK